MWNKKVCVLLGALALIWGVELTFLRRALTPRENRFLLCITSHKRPTFLSGQVLRLMQQTYPHFDISLSIKGVPSTFVRENLQAEWQDFISAGRVRLRLDKNRDQFSNFLDTVRYVDLSRYDWFCRLDDDDWYSADYLTHVNEALKKEPKVVMTHTPHAFIMGENIRTITYLYNEDEERPETASTMCFSRAVIKKALRLEDNSRAFRHFFRSRRIADAASMRQGQEDELMRQIALSLGPVQVRQTPQNDVIFGRQYPSLKRNKDFAYLPDTSQKEGEKSDKEEIKFPKRNKEGKLK